LWASGINPDAALAGGQGECKLETRGGSKHYMSNKKEIVIIKERRQRCITPILFPHWSPEQTYTVLKNVFAQDATWLPHNVLNPAFRAYLKKTAKRHHWSFGYCFDIVEAVKIVFDSASLTYQPFVKKTKKTGNRHLDKHYVLKVADYAFDPAVGGKVPWLGYGGYCKSRSLPQSPGKRVIALYVRILDYCCCNNLFTSEQQKEVQNLKTALPNFERRLQEAR
jgi:hypothetical protein